MDKLALASLGLPYPAAGTCAIPPPYASWAHPLARRGAPTELAKALALGPGGYADRVQVKLMRWGEYQSGGAGIGFGGFGPAAPPYSADQLTVHADDPVLVVAFHGLWYPEGNRGGAGAHDTGLLVYNAKTGVRVGAQWYFSDNGWPPIFDALPDHANLPCARG